MLKQIIGCTGLAVFFTLIPTGYAASPLERSSVLPQLQSGQPALAEYSGVDDIPVYNAESKNPNSMDGWRQRFYVSPGFTKVDLKTVSGELNLVDIGPTTSLVIDNGPVEGSGAAIVGATQLVVYIGYKFKRFSRLSVETAIAPPLEFGLQLTGTARDESLAPYALCPSDDTSQCVETGIPALGANLGTTKALPVLVTLAYQFAPVGRLEPYAGFGFTYVYTYDPDVSNSVLTENGAQPELKLVSGLGALMQLGVRYRINERLSLNADVKYSTSIDSNASVSGIELISPTVGSVLGPAELGKVTVDAGIQAVIYHIGISYQF